MQRMKLVGLRNWKETKRSKANAWKLKASRVLKWSSLAPKTLETLHCLHVLNYSTNDKEFCTLTTQLNTMKILLKIKIPKLCTPCVCAFASLVYHSFGVLCSRKLFCSITAFLIVNHFPIVLGSSTLDVLAPTQLKCFTKVLIHREVTKYKAIKANLNSTNQRIIKW